MRTAREAIEYLATTTTHLHDAVWDGATRWPEEYVPPEPEQWKSPVS